MATKIFPSVNDINGGVAGQGKTLTEANLKTLQSMPYYDKPYVKSGAALSNGGGLNLTVGAGHYMIDGRWIYKDANETVALTASSTCRVWLQQTVDGSGNVNGSTWVVQTTAAVPAGQPAVLVGIVVTGASTITTIYTSFRGIIAPGKQVYNEIRTSLYTATVGATSYGAALFAGTTLTGDGQTGMKIESNWGAMWTDVAVGGIVNAVRDTTAGADLANASHVTGTTANPSAAFAYIVPFAQVRVVNAFWYNGTGGARGITSNSAASMPANFRFEWDF